MGQPILLPPGLHCWTSETLHFDHMYKLDDKPVLQMGPYTVITANENCTALTINNGKCVLLEGGKMHLLTHLKWKFHSFISLNLQSDELLELNVKSADSVNLNVDSVVFWKVTDIEVAAWSVLDGTPSNHPTDNATNSIGNLRHKVFRQTTAVISRFISNVRFSQCNEKMQLDADFFKKEELDTVQNDASESYIAENLIFNNNLLDDFVSNTRMITTRFGVEIQKIIITAAYPSDQEIASTLQHNIVTMTEARKDIISARSKASMIKIEADAKATSNIIIAESEADMILKRAQAEAEADVLRADGVKKADILRAEGSRQVGKILEDSSVAVNLEVMKTSALAIKESDKFFFGNDPNYLSKVVMNLNDKK